MQTDGRTDITKLIYAFRNFSNAPKIQKPYHGPSSASSHFLQHKDGFSGFSRMLRGEQDFPVSIIPLVLHNHSVISYRRCSILEMNSVVNKRKTRENSVIEWSVLRQVQSLFQNTSPHSAI